MENFTQQLKLRLIDRSMIILELSEHRNFILTKQNNVIIALKLIIHMKLKSVD